VGQRRGLGLATGEPLYVIGIDAGSNAVTVGPRESLECGGLLTAAVNWMLPAPPKAGTRATIKIRSQHAGAGGTLEPLDDGTVRVRFDVPQSAVAPGQLAAFYSGERLLGGAPIERSEPGA
jgi:tRNA-specific 2-thiouridylase